jgi:hypothetical protein
MDSFLDSIARLVCHREAARTISMVCGPLPFCARCTGIYSSFLLVWIGLWLFRGTRRAIFGRLTETLPGALMLGVGLGLAVLEAGGLILLPRGPRMAAGALTGGGLALLVRPIYNQLVGGSGERTGTFLRAAAMALVVIAALRLVLFADCAPTYHFFVWSTWAGLGLLYLVTNANVASLILGRKYEPAAAKSRILLLLLTLALVAGEALLIHSLKGRIRLF